MASKKSYDTAYNNQEKDVISTCPVCTERYRDPRILHCGHHFCLPCLEKIASGHPDGHIICPTCRHLTDVTDVSKLNKYKISEFQFKAKDFISKQPQKVEKPCVYCKNKAKATMSCLECFISFCDECTIIHQTAVQVLNHRVLPISANHFCKTHSDWFIQCICNQCYIGCCHLCMNEHRDHKLVNLRTAANEAREALAQEVISLNNPQDEEVFQRITKLAMEYKETQDHFMDSIGNIRKYLQKLLGTIDQIESKFEQCINTKVKRIEILEYDAKEFMTTKNDLQKCIEDLLKEASDADIVFKCRELPTYASSTLLNSIKKDIEDQVIQYVDLSTIKNFEDKLLSCSLNLEDMLLKPYHMSRLCNSFSLGNLELSSKLEFPIDGMRSDHIHVHYARDERNIFVVTFYKFLVAMDSRSGEIVNCINIGNDVKTSFLTSVGYDTKRKCFLIPTRQGSIVTIDLDTRNREVITVTDNVLHGAAYAESKDLYVVSSAGGDYKGEDCIFVVDPEKKETIHSFKPNVESAAPLFVGCGFDKSLHEDEVIYLSCHLADCIEVHDVDGKLLHTYENEINMFNSPDGLYLRNDLKLACEYGTGEVVRFWRDKDGNHKETIISKDMIDGLSPSDVYFNEKSRELYVCCDSKHIYVFKEKQKMLY